MCWREEESTCTQRGSGPPGVGGRGGLGRGEGLAGAARRETQRKQVGSGLRELRGRRVRRPAKRELHGWLGGSQDEGLENAVKLRGPLHKQVQLRRERPGLNSGQAQGDAGKLKRNPFPPPPRWRWGAQARPDGAGDSAAWWAGGEGGRADPGPVERRVAGCLQTATGPSPSGRGGRRRPALTLGDPAEAQDVLGPDGVQGQQLLLRDCCPEAVVGCVVGRLPPRLEPVQDAAACLLLLVLVSHQPPGPSRRPRARRLRVRPAHRSAAKMAAASRAP